MQVRQAAAWTVAAMAITAGVTACSGGGGDADRDVAADAYVAKLGIAEPQHLIPSNTTESAGNQVLAALFSPLVDFDAKNVPYEVAAESITTADNVRWTVKLKPGYTFHNGEPVTADNYLDAWNYGAYGPNAQDGGYFFEKITGYPDLQSTDPDGDGPKKAPEPRAKTLTGLKKVDDLTFTVTLAQPFSEFKSVLGYTVFYPLPKAAFSAPGVIADGFEDAVIGQGPFRMKGTWQHDSRIEVQRYDAFPATKPKVAGIAFTIYQQPASQYADLLAGNNDVMATIPVESLANAGSDLGDRFRKSPLSSFQFLAFPTFQPEFARADVRRAISMAIDRDEIVQAVFLGSQTSARSFVSPVVVGYRENTCGDACAFDAAKAKALYTSAGGPGRLQISYNGDGGHKAWVDATCGQLRTNLGVECAGTAETRFADLLTKVENRTPVGMFRMAWSMDYPSMENYLGPLYTANGSSNYYGYRNPEFDRLVQEGTRQATVSQSIAKYQQAEQILARDMPVIPLRFGQNVYGFSENVRNVHLDQFGKVDLFALEAR